MVIFWALLLITLLLNAWFYAALVLYVCKRTDTVKEALTQGIGRLPRLIGGWILVTLLVFAILIVCFLMVLLCGALFGDGVSMAISMVIFTLLGLAGFVWIGVAWLFLPYRLVLTQEGVFSCFGSSRRLVKGMFWKTLGFLCVLLLIVFGVNIAAGLVMGLLSLIVMLLTPSLLNIALSFLGMLVTGLTMLVVQLPLIALYLDRNAGGQQPIVQEENHPSLEQGPQQ